MTVISLVYPFLVLRRIPFVFKENNHNVNNNTASVLIALEREKKKESTFPENSRNKKIGHSGLLIT